MAEALVTSSGSERFVSTRKEHFVQRLFDALAPKYDAFNAVASLGMHRSWRRRTLELLKLERGETLADFCCGTGDFLELAAPLLGEPGRLIGIDFSPEMLERARQRLTLGPGSPKLELILGNVENSGLPAGSVDAITCGYALRNVDSLERTFAEMYRVLRPGGRVGLLELSRPRQRLLRWGYWVYLERVLPLVSRPLVRDRAALSYLSSSVKGFREPEEVLDLLREAGFRDARRETVFLGVCSIYLAVRPA